MTVWYESWIGIASLRSVVLFISIYIYIYIYPKYRYLQLILKIETQFTEAYIYRHKCSLSPCIINDPAERCFCVPSFQARRKAPPPAWLFPLMRLSTLLQRLCFSLPIHRVTHPADMSTTPSCCGAVGAKKLWNLGCRDDLMLISAVFRVC